MAITFNTQPSSGGFYPAYKPVYFDISSNHGQIVNIVSDIFINSTVYFGTITTQVDSNGHAKIDIRQLIQAYLNTNLYNNKWHLPNVAETPTVHNMTYYDCTVQLNCYEEYNDGTTGLLDCPGWATGGAGTPVASSNSFQVVNATKQQTESADIAAYMGGGGTQLFLTKAPQNILVRTDQSYYLSYFWKVPTYPVKRVYVILYNAAGSQVGSGLYYTDPNLNNFSIIGVGPANLITAGVSLSGIAYYTVDADYNVSGSTYAQTTISMRFIIDTGNNYALNPIPIHFLNSLGGWDSFTFTGFTQKNTTVKKSEIYRYRGNGAAGTDPGHFPIEINAVNMYEAESRPLSDAEAEWLQDLLTSPVVYLERSGSYYAIMIQDATWSTESVDDPYSILAIKWQFAEDIIRQIN